MGVKFIQLSEMLQFKYQQTYKEVIKAWSQSILKERPPRQYYDSFLHKISQYSSISIIYDDRVADVVLSLLKSFPFQVFNRQSLNKESQKRRRNLFVIIDVLKQEGFIGRQEHQAIQAQKEIYLQDKLKLFLFYCKQEKYEGDKLSDLWFSIVGMDLTTFWNYAELQNMKDPILVEIYKQVCRCKEISNIKSISTFIQSILKKNQPPIQPIARPINSPMRYRRRQPSKLNQTFSIINPIVFNSQREEYKKRKNELYQNMWFNSAKYDLYYQYISSVKENSNLYTLLLTQLAFSHSLFFNPKYKSILRSIFTFIEDLQTRIEHHKIVSYQYFGSIRSTLALSCQFDIDLTSIKAVSNRGKPRELSREDIVDLLFQIKKKLEGTTPIWLEKLTVFKFEKIRIPFLKIEMQKDSLKRQFGLQGIQKLDITIGNKQAIKNSQIISYFARVPEISCFCLLIKLWAKNNEVINSKFPMRGLSSYGVILMCLYYLMQTKQISFLLLAQGFDIDKTQLTPNLDLCQILDLQQNFIGFLQFYKQTGVFQRQKKIVCLLLDSQQAQAKFNQDIVINMYDFIDKSNPGRLPFKDKDNLFSPIERALRIMKLRNQRQIEQLILKKMIQMCV